jgi:hypothetical protein
MEIIILLHNLIYMYSEMTECILLLQENWLQYDTRVSISQHKKTLVFVYIIFVDININFVTPFWNNLVIYI